MSRPKHLSQFYLPPYLPLFPQCFPPSSFTTLPLIYLSLFYHPCPISPYSQLFFWCFRFFPFFLPFCLFPLIHHHLLYISTPCFTTPSHYAFFTILPLLTPPNCTTFPLTCFPTLPPIFPPLP